MKAKEGSGGGRRGERKVKGEVRKRNEEDVHDGEEERG